MLVLAIMMTSVSSSRADEISLFVVTGQSNARLQFAIGIESGLRASGDWERVKVFHAYRSGNWLVEWVAGYDGAYSPGSNYTEDLWASDGSSGLQQYIAALEGEGHTVTIEGFFWFQGEGDTGSQLHQGEYQPRLTWMLNELWSHYGGFDVVLTKIDWNHNLPDELAAINRTPEDVEAIRTALQATADDLGIGIMDSADRVRADVWHIADAADPRGYYGVATDFGADQARLMIERSSCEADLTGDGTLDIFDVFKYLEIYNTGCP